MGEIRLRAAEPICILRVFVMRHEPGDNVNAPSYAQWEVPLRDPYSELAIPRGRAVSLQRTRILRERYRPGGRTFHADLGPLR